MAGKLKILPVEGLLKMDHVYSVVMSVYHKDSPEFLATALKSIYEDQTRKPDEIVVVADGPITNGLQRVLDDFRVGKEDIVNYYYLERNCGLGEALRIGTQKCRGDYIFRMDSDDVSVPERFEKQIKYVENHPETDVLGTDIAEFNDENDNYKRIRSCPAEHKDIVRMGKRRNPMNHVSVCMKRSALEKSGGYKPLLLLEDYYLWLRMIVAGCKMANLNVPLVNVRVGNGFESKRGAKARAVGWRVLQDYMVEHGMISRFTACTNMICIHAFVRTPTVVKKLLYNRILRK